MGMFTRAEFFQDGFVYPYGPKARVALDFPASEGPHGRTKQSFADECDVNNIMARFQKTGLLDFVNRHEGQYGDVTALDFTRAMDQVAGARTMFSELPAKLRDRFQNDPAQFLMFVQNSDNRAEARELGLLKPEPSNLPPVVPAPPEPAKAAQATPVAPPPSNAAPAAS